MSSSKWPKKGSAQKMIFFSDFDDFQKKIVFLTAHTASSKMLATFNKKTFGKLTT